MYFMIDFENTGSGGLKGVEYLSREDTLCIFFSQCCGKIEHGVLRQIMNSRCSVEGVKLTRNGKNALDFYIASRLGEVFGSGYEGAVAIVSRDKGFKAVQDYWKQSDAGRKNVILNVSIEQCIASAAEDNARTRKIREDIRSVTVDYLLEEAKKRSVLHQRIGDRFSEHICEEDMTAVTEILAAAPGKRAVYLACLKAFGKDKGRQIYRKAKEILELEKNVSAPKSELIFREKM